MPMNTGEKLAYFDDHGTIFWVQYARFDGSCHEYRWGIEAGGETIATGEDLRSAADGKLPPLAEMLESFLGFLSAWVEAVELDNDVPDSNRDLFDMSNEKLVGLAYAYNSSDLAMYGEIIKNGNPYDG